MDTFRKEYKPLTEEQKAAMLEVKEIAEKMYEVIEKTQFAQVPSEAEVSPAGTRYSSLAKTKLEECVMWAVKGITS